MKAYKEFEKYVDLLPAHRVYKTTLMTLFREAIEETKTEEFFRGLNNTTQRINEIEKPLSAINKGSGHVIQ